MKLKDLIEVMNIKHERVQIMRTRYGVCFETIHIYDRWGDMPETLLNGKVIDIRKSYYGDIRIAVDYGGVL